MEVSELRITAAELGIALKTLYNRLNQSALQSEVG